MTYDSSEQDVLMHVFCEMLWDATGDGGTKRAAGTKPPWYKDGSHEAALFSHLDRWKHHELADPDSGAHPLVHLAWRALALAYQEKYGPVNPKDRFYQLAMLDQEVVEEPDDEASEQEPEGFDARDFTNVPGEGLGLIGLIQESYNLPDQEEQDDDDPPDAMPLVPLHT